MGLRTLIATLIALAIAFAPFASLGVAAAAELAPQHHSQMTDTSHCGDTSPGDHSEQAGDQSCCIATCTAVALNPPTAHEFEPRPAANRRASPSRFRHNYLADLPTPPPRLG